MALIPCRHCGRSVSDKAPFCPGCGQPVAAPRFCAECGAKLTENAAYCISCGCPVEIPPASSCTAAPATKKPSGQPLLLVLAAVILLVILFRQNNNSSPAVIPNTTILWGDDKAAYELLLDAAYDFKEPSSVRLVSGCVGVDKDCLFCGISATNGFGARTTSYYYICADFILEEEDPGYLYTKTDELDVDKINKKLAENFQGY